MKKQPPALYFIQEHLLTTGIRHGGIGNQDIERVLLQRGFRPILFPGHFAFTLTAKLKRLRYLLKMLTTLPAGSVVLFQHPLYAGMSRLLVGALLRRNIKLVCFITDMDGLRDGNVLQLEREKKLFRQFRYLVVHNECMQAYLAAFHPGAQQAAIECFDFLTTPVRVQRPCTTTLVFAGNLHKSPFLLQLDRLAAAQPGLVFHIYGDNKGLTIPFGATCLDKGAHPPGTLPGLLEGSFGLLWDGNSLEGLSGPAGDYLRYNSPHKLSLYVVAALPVITHPHTAAAVLVKKYGIGLLVDSLYAVEAAVRALTPEQYAAMQQACLALADRIASGGCIGAALDQLLASD